MGETTSDIVKMRARIAGFVVLFCLAGLVYYTWPNWYLWVKAGHIIAVISWMAGLLYLPRLFVYHTEELEKSDAGSAVIFEKMEERLLRIIMGPAQGIAWVFGLVLLSQQSFDNVWIWLKLGSVICLSYFHVFLSRSHGNLKQGICSISSKRWRLLNEVPAVLMIIIVICVVVKPF